VSAYDIEPKTRRERLAAIAAEYTERVHDAKTGKQLGATEPVSRLAAVTSEGSIESSHASNGNLVVADTEPELAERLRQEAGEGWLPHGRVWDLDAPWHLWGNLPVSLVVRVGEDATRPVQVVSVSGREEGIYLFDELLDAETFAQAVRGHGGEAALGEQPVLDNRAADRLIDAEREH
jgi:hypothetical protein